MRHTITAPAGVVVDTDVHNALPDLNSFIPGVWKAGWRTSTNPGRNYGNPRGNVARDDATPPNGGSAGSDPYFLISDHMDPYGVDYAILTGPASWPLGADRDHSNMMVRAMNECMAAT